MRSLNSGYIEERGITKMDFEKLLTPLEHEICKLLADEGYTNKEIGAELHMAEGTVKNHISTILYKTGIVNRSKLGSKYSVYLEKKVIPPIGDPPDTIVYSKWLRLINHASRRTDLPCYIPLDWGDDNNQPFVIGRYAKKCNFAFDEGITAISRCHASIVHTAFGYTVVDNNSANGTFVNRNRLTPNEPFPLIVGDQITFGIYDATYVFEDVNIFENIDTNEKTKAEAVPL